MAIYDLIAENAIYMHIYHSTPTLYPIQLRPLTVVWSAGRVSIVRNMITQPIQNSVY